MSHDHFNFQHKLHKQFKQEIDIAQQWFKKYGINIKIETGIHDDNDVKRPYLIEQHDWKLSNKLFNFLQIGIQKLQYDLETYCYNDDNNWENIKLFIDLTTQDIIVYFDALINQHIMNKFRLNEWQGHIACSTEGICMFFAYFGQLINEYIELEETYYRYKYNIALGEYFIGSNKNKNNLWV